jgi:hypothetical protein
MDSTLRSLCVVGRRGDRSERGAVFFEFTLVLPLFLSLVLGIYTGGMAYTNKIALVEAVREGSRYGASLATGNAVNAVATWQASVRDRVVASSGGALTANDVCVAFVLPTPISSTTTTTIANWDCGVSDPAGAINEPLVHLVKVSATRPAKMEFFLFSKSTVLRASAVARFERDTG